jgi:alpha-tubulin suppressor-like RCC1 family protein
MLQKIPVISIACGAYHSMAVDHHNQIYCWGEAMYGQTGTGKKTKEPIPTKLSIKVKVNYLLFRAKPGK